MCHILGNISTDMFTSIPNWSSDIPFYIFMEEEALDSKCVEGTLSSHVTLRSGLVTSIQIPIYSM